MNATEITNIKKLFILMPEIDSLLLLLLLLLFVNVVDLMLSTIC